MSAKEPERRGEEDQDLQSLLEPLSAHAAINEVTAGAYGPSLTFASALGAMTELGMKLTAKGEYNTLVINPRMKNRKSIPFRVVSIDDVSGKYFADMIGERDTGPDPYALAIYAIGSSSLFPTVYLTTTNRAAPQEQMAIQIASVSFKVEAQVKDAMIRDISLSSNPFGQLIKELAFKFQDGKLSALFLRQYTIVPDPIALNLVQLSKRIDRFHTVMENYISEEGALNVLGQDEELIRRNILTITKHLGHQLTPEEIDNLLDRVLDGEKQEIILTLLSGVNEQERLSYYLRLLQEEYIPIIAADNLSAQANCLPFLPNSLDTRSVLVDAQGQAVNLLPEWEQRAQNFMKENGNLIMNLQSILHATFDRSLPYIISLLKNGVEISE